jgi:hypothetical protein
LNANTADDAMLADGTASALRLHQSPRHAEGETEGFLVFSAARRLDVHRSRFEIKSTVKHLQLVFTVEDEGVFTTPWTATITFGRGSDEWPETVCAENIHQYYFSKDSEVPTADKPDF